MGIFAMLSPYLSGALAVKGLEKLDPTLKKFFGYGAAAGYGTDQVLDFLRSKVESQGHQGLKKKLEEGDQAGTLRPDERATKERMRQAELPADIAQRALSTAGGIAGGALGAGIGLAGKGVQQASKAVSPDEIQQLGHRPKPQLADQRFADVNIAPPDVIQANQQAGTPENRQFSIPPPPPKGQFENREQALTHVNEMHKRKKLLDQALQDFENQYGSAQLPARAQEFPRAQSAPQPRRLSAKEERIIQLLQQRKQGGR